MFVFKIGGQLGYTTLYDPDNLVQHTCSCTPLTVFMDNTTIRCESVSIVYPRVHDMTTQTKGGLLCARNEVSVHRSSKK